MEKKMSKETITGLQTSIQNRIKTAIRHINRGQSWKAVEVLEEALKESKRLEEGIDDLHGRYVNLRKESYGENVTIRFKWEYK